MLNPILHAALERKFRNAGGVRVVNEDIKNEWRPGMYQGKPRSELVSRGENYAVCCPFCGDTRYRLYINYEFGTCGTDGQTSLGLVNCFNEECFQFNPDLKSILFNEVLFGRPISKAFMSMSKAKARAEYTPAGDLVPLHRLGRDHIAVKYLRERGYNVQKLSALYGVSWCASSHMVNVRARIIIPVMSEGKEVGWMARLPQDGDFFTNSGYKVPKYYNMPGFQRQRHLYNYDQAKTYKSVVLVEGALDCISVGGPAVGLLGKSISPHNADRLCAHVTRTGGALVVALDPDKSESDRDSKHHIEVVADRLRERLDTNPVLPLYLPTGTDPGSLSGGEFQRLLRVAADEAGIEVQF